MEDAFHCNPDGLVVGVDRFWVVRPAGWVERLSGGQEGFDSFVSEDEPLPARNAANHSGTRRSGRQRCGARDLQKSRDNRTMAAKALGPRDLTMSTCRARRSTSPD